MGDRILAINMETMHDKTIDDAYRILQNSGDTVTLRISKGMVGRKPSRFNFGGHHKIAVHSQFYQAESDVQLRISSWFRQFG